MISWSRLFFGTDVDEMVLMDSARFVVILILACGAAAAAPCKAHRMSGVSFGKGFTIENFFCECSARYSTKFSPRDELFSRRSCGKAQIFDDNSENLTLCPDPACSTNVFINGKRINVPSFSSK